MESLSTDEVLEIFKFLPSKEIHKMTLFKHFQPLLSTNQFWKIFYKNTIQSKLTSVEENKSKLKPKKQNKYKNYYQDLLVTMMTESTCFKTELWKFHQKETSKELNRILKNFSFKYPCPRLHDWKVLFEKISKFNHQNITKSVVKKFENSDIGDLFYFFTMGLSHGFNYPTGYFLYFTNEKSLKWMKKEEVGIVKKILKEFVLYYEIKILKSTNNGMNPFYWLIKTNDFDLIDFAVKYALRDDFNLLNSEIKSLGTPLEFSCKNGSSIEIVNLLLDSGVEYHFRQNLKLRSNYMKYALTMSDIQLVRYFFENPKKFHTKINQLNLRMVFSSDFKVWGVDNRLEVLKYLVEEKKMIIPHGLGIISMAFRVFAYHKNSQILFETIKYLIENGADINELYQGKTPLHESTQIQDLNLVTFLLSKGANRNIPDLVGKIPEEYANGFKMKMEFYKNALSNWFKIPTL
jgi:ankyrin repeat protein